MEEQQFSMPKPELLPYIELDELKALYRHFRPKLSENLSRDERIDLEISLSYLQRELQEREEELE